MSRNYCRHYRSRQPQLSPEERKQLFYDKIADFLPNYIGGQVSCWSKKGWGREREEKRWVIQSQGLSMEGDELVIQVEWAAKDRTPNSSLRDWHQWRIQEFRISLDFASKDRQMPYGRLILKVHTEDGFENVLAFRHPGDVNLEKKYVKGLGRTW